jgi:quercetin dioxygenase-like cupin family protein
MPTYLTRRKLLRSAPLAAASAVLARNSAAAALQTPEVSPAGFQLINAAQIAAAVHQTQTVPGNDSLVNAPNTTVVVTTEVKKAGKEFEYHERRDHLFQILAGETEYELGGTPQSPRQTRPGEWLAPAAAGSSRITLRQGDSLFIPRGTPHKRTTEVSVTFILISSQNA